MDVTVQKIDNSIEELILTGMIVDSSFLKELYRSTKQEYFNSEQVKIVVGWIREYYEINKESPGEDIKEIYEIKKHTLDDDEAITIRLFLKKVSEEYSGKAFNSKYVADKAYKYLELNAYTWRIKEIQRFIRKGDIETAKDLFNGTNKEVFAEMSRWKSFSDEELLGTWWWDRKESLLHFPGELGSYMPRIERSRLYAMLGPAKRSKSFWLLEWGVNGVMEGLNVVIFSLEMSVAELHERWVQRLSGKEIMQEEEKEYNIPVVDCVFNQTGECQRDECTSYGTCVIDEKGNPEPYEKHREHKPCTQCRGTSRFEPCSWFITEKISRLSYQESKQCQIMFDEHFGKDRCRFLTFPIGTQPVSGIEKALDELEDREGFIADLVVIDYADILQKDRHTKDKRNQIGEIWEELSRLAKVKNIALVTASQGNRGSMKKDRLSVDDVAEDISKVMTIDGLFAINEVGFQEEEVHKKDRYWQKQRIETLALRYSKFVPGRQCVVLNDFSRGQVALDSYIN